MSRHDLLLHSAMYSDDVKPRTLIDTEIQTGLRRAFPLSAEGQGDDEPFRLLLVALARRHGPGSRQPSAPFAGARS